jgi:hypothetical protein
MARHASQAVLPRVIGSFGDSVKYYFRGKNRFNQFLQMVIYEVLYYHIFLRCFLGFAAPHPSHLPIAFVARTYCAGFI